MLPVCIDLTCILNTSNAVYKLSFNSSLKEQPFSEVFLGDRLVDAGVKHLDVDASSYYCITQEKKRRTFKLPFSGVTEGGIQHSDGGRLQPMVLC